VAVPTLLLAVLPLLDRPLQQLPLGGLAQRAVQALAPIALGPWLAAQVEPHFLFNTLAGVRSAIATDPGRASDMIDRLVNYLRAAIPRLRNPCPTAVPASTHMPPPAAPGWA